MKKNAKNFESGQAMILIVFALVGLIGMTALTVDGGFAYSDHRHAQNAADTASFAAARAKIRGENWKAAALALASLNGYVDTDPGPASSSNLVNVEVYQCSEAHAPGCGTYANPEEYIHVLITSTINTFFGKVIGISQVTNQANAITHAKPGSLNSTSFGNAMESMMPGCKDNGWNHDPYTISGTGDMIVTGSGVKVNSNCNKAFTQNGSSTMSAPGICVVGTSYLQNPNSVSPAPQDHCGEPSPIRQWPNPSCDLDGDKVMDANEMGKITEVAGSVWTSTPGYYVGDFPTGASGQLLMQKGIYCIGGDFSVNSTLNVTTDVNQNGTYDYISEGVLIYLKTGGVHLNGSSLLYLHAISDPSAPLGIQNLLIFLPLGNSSPLQINGGSSSQFVGSIWAPSSLVTLNGSAGGTTVNSQVIGNSIEVAGNGKLAINYVENQNAVTMSPASIELNK